MKRHLPWALAAALALAALPLFLGANAIDKLTTLFIFMLLASTWALLAGQAGLVSVGQQAFFGLGAYFALRLVDGDRPMPGDERGQIVALDQLHHERTKHRLP